LFQTEIFVFHHKRVTLPSHHSITARLSFPIVLTLSQEDNFFFSHIIMIFSFIIAFHFMRERYEFVSTLLEEYATYI
jgi:hypothetical protein